MRFLFIHQNFPGQFVHLVRHLLRQAMHDIVFISEPNRNSIPGVRRLTYSPVARPGEATHGDARDFAQATARAAAVAATARKLKDLGFTPDIVIGHHGWGELLNIKDVWPSAPLLGYYELYFHDDALDVGFDPEFPANPASLPSIRARNTVNLLALTNPGCGHTPTRYQLETYPSWAQSRIEVLEEGVDLEICRPTWAGPRALSVGSVTIDERDEVVTYVSRDLEPYRGFHVFMRALPRLMRARPKARVIMLGGDGVSYGPKLMSGTWRGAMLRELGQALDQDRLHFLGRVDYSTYVQLLQRSDCHVYLTYPFVVSWSLREALACGCAVVGSDTAPVRELVYDGRTGWLTPFFDRDALSSVMETVLEGGPDVAARRMQARAWAEEHLDLHDYLKRYAALIERVAGRSITTPSSRARLVRGKPLLRA